MKKKHLGLYAFIFMILFLVACSDSDESLVSDSNDSNDKTSVTDDGQDLEQISRTLFNSLINIEAKSSPEEGFNLIEEVVYSPEEYIKTLDENNLDFHYGSYERATAAHREESIKSIGDDHYEYTSMATIEVFYELDSEPAVGYADIKMELKKKDNEWKIFKVNISPQE